MDDDCKAIPRKLKSIWTKGTCPQKTNQTLLFWFNDEYQYFSYHTMQIHTGKITNFAMLLKLAQPVECICVHSESRRQYAKLVKAQSGIVLTLVKHDASITNCEQFVS
jgi:hypothetical protein